MAHAQLDKTLIDKQASFAGGEISPEVYGRTDHPAFKTGLKLARNFIPTKHGAIKNRSGTKFVATSQTPIGIAPRLIPFNFSDGQTFVLEFGNLYCAVYQNGGPVVVGGNPLTFHTPWVIGDVWSLKYAQSGDVITICCRGSAATPVVINGAGATTQGPSPVGYPPYDVSRTAGNVWTVAQSLTAPPAWPFAALTNLSEPLISAGCPAGTPPGYVGGVPLAYNQGSNYVSGAIVKYALPTNNPDGATTEWVSVGILNQPPAQIPGAIFNGSTYWAPYTYDPSVVYGYQQYVWCFLNGSTGPATLFMSLYSGNVGVIPGQTAGWATWWVAANDASHPSHAVTYAVTAMLKNNKGVVVESMPTYLTPVAGVFPRFSDRPFVIGLNPTALADYVVTGFNVYAGTNGVFGLIDSVAATATYYQDVGNAINYNIAPPAGTNPFTVHNNGAIAYSWPAVVSYFQQRRLFARSAVFPGNLWGSAEGNFLNFDTPLFIVDSDSYDFQIASQRLQEIRSISPQRELFIESVGGEFVASGSNGGVGGAITPSSIDIRESSSHGSSWLDPIYIDRTLLSITSKGNYVRKLTYDWRTANYIGSDISSLVRHLLNGFTIVDWFYAEVPDAQVWMVRSDGNLVSITLDPDFEVTCYAQHDTNAAILGNAQGQFKAVCSVPEGTEDAVYFVVQRLVNGQQVYNIERLSSRFIQGPRDGTDYRQSCFLDCAYQYNGRNTSVTSTVLSVAPIGNGQYTVTLTNAAIINGAVRNFVANDAAVNNVVVLAPDSINQPAVDDVPVAPLPPVSLRIVGYTSGVVVTCELDGPPPASWAPYLGTTAWALATQVFSGLAALGGQAVGALVDGQADLGSAGNIVQAGAIKTTKPGVDVIIGLPYFSDMQQLDIANDSAKTNVKQVEMVTVEVALSRTFLAGEDFSHLGPAYQRNVPDGYGASPLYTGLIQLPISNSWNLSGSLCIRMQDPLPLTIVSVLREITIGGRS